MSDSWDYENGPDPAMQRAAARYVLGNTNNYMQPSFSPAQYGIFGQNVPMGEDQLDWEKDATYLAQNQLDLLSDPMTAILSGEGGFDPTQFQPQVSYERLARPGYDFLSRQIRKAPVMDPKTGQPVIDPQTGQPVIGPAPEQTFSGIVADEIINNQGSSTSAMAKVKMLLQNWDEQGVGNDPENPQYQQYQMLASSLPSMQGEFAQPGDPPVIDWMQAQNDAEAWEITYHEDPQVGAAGGVVYDEQGNQLSTGGGINEIQYDAQGNQILVQKTEEPTPTMELFQDYGIPLPTERYEAADFMGPDWAAGQQAYQAAQAEQQAMRQMIVQGGAMPGGQEWMGEKAYKRQGRALNRAEADYKTAVEESMRKAAGGYVDPRSKLEQKMELPERYAGVNLEAMDPAMRRRYVEGAISENARYEKEGGISATGTVGDKLFGTSVDVPSMTGLGAAAGNLPGAAAGLAAEAYGETAGRLPGPFRYTVPGASIAGFLEDVENISPEQIKKAEDQKALHQQYKQLERRRKRYEGNQQIYQGLQSGLSSFGEQISGAGNELFGADYGHALAQEFILNQQQRTPYTDALMQRRMVPMAAGIQQGAWMPSSGGSTNSQTNWLLQ